MIRKLSLHLHHYKQDKKAGKLKYYRDETHELQGELPIGQLDLSTATFCYDVETDTSGEFTIV